jgi:hypothetical protein
MDDFTKELFDENSDPDEAAKMVLKKLNTEIENELFGLTVNAPDWYAPSKYPCSHGSMTSF